MDFMHSIHLRFCIGVFTFLFGCGLTQARAQVPASSRVRQIINGTAFRCSVRSKAIRADLMLSTTGQGQLLLSEVGHKTPFVCALTTNEFVDGRKSMTQDYRMTFHLKRCDPELTPPLNDRLADEISAQISFFTGKKPAARLFFRKDQDGQNCRIRKLRMVDLETISRRRKAIRSRTLIIPPPNEKPSR